VNAKRTRRLGGEGTSSVSEGTDKMLKCCETDAERNNKTQIWAHQAPHDAVNASSSRKVSCTVLFVYRCVHAPREQSIRVTSVLFICFPLACIGHVTSTPPLRTSHASSV
jgi:hypothetical protein